jgi:hypothetical protein
MIVERRPAAPTLLRRSIVHAIGVGIVLISTHALFRFGGLVVSVLIGAAAHSLVMSASGCQGREGKDYD